MTTFVTCVFWFGVRKNKYLSIQAIEEEVEVNCVFYLSFKQDHAHRLVGVYFAD